MHNRICRIISATLCFVLLFAVCVLPNTTLDVSAAKYRTGANNAHSSYLGSKYYKNYSKIEITGDGRTDVVAVALSQLGYQESPTSYDFDGIGGGSGNNTEFNYNMGDFGVGYGGSNYDWCASFVAWSLFQSYCTDQDSMGDWCRKHDGINGTYDKEYIWREVGCGHWANQLRRSGYFERSKAYNGNTYKPQPGDLIFFCWDGPTGGEDHIGIVVYSDSNYVYTVEGNTANQNGLEDDGGGVYFKRYDLGYEYITGYGVLPYKTNSNVQKIDYSGANPTPGYYISNASKSIYASEDSNTVAYNSERFTMFEVVGVAANGRLKVRGITTTTGAVVDGYILNNTDRVIQISATEFSPEEQLETAIAKARVVRYDKYTEEDLALLRTAFDEAVAISEKSNASEKEMLSAADKLEAALARTADKNETVVSVGKSYTATAGGRTDIYVDDGIRLTDGRKDEINGGTDKFSGFNSKTPIEVVIDLGKSTPTDTYRIYTARMESWGIAAPEELSVSVSNNGKDFTAIGHTTVRSRTYASEGWNMFTYTVRSETARTERYIKFTVTPGSNHIWLQEVEALEAPKAASGSVYVTGMNKSIVSGDTVVFTPGLGKMESSTYNFRYTKNVIATWNGTNYVISSITQGNGDSTPAITLNDNQILICAHDWEEGTDDPVLGSHANVSLLANAKVGDVIELVNIDIENKELSAAPLINLPSTGSGEKPASGKLGDVNADGVINQYDYILVKRHHFATRTLTDAEFTRADVNKDGVVNQYDYLLIARHYFGTYVIQ